MGKKKETLTELAQKQRYVALLEKMKEDTLTLSEIRELEEMEKKTTKKPAKLNYARATQALTCLILGKKPSRINQWKSKGMLGGYKEGEKWLYNIAEIFDWRVQYERVLTETLFSGEENKANADFAKDHARREKALAELAIIRAGKEQKKIVDLSDVVMVWDEIGAFMGTRFKQLKQKYGKEIPTKDIEALFRDGQRLFDRRYPDAPKVKAKPEKKKKPKPKPKKKKKPAKMKKKPKAKKKVVKKKTKPKRGKQ